MGHEPLPAESADTRAETVRSGRGTGKRRAVRFQSDANSGDVSLTSKGLTASLDFARSRRFVILGLLSLLALIAFSAIIAYLTNQAMKQLVAHSVRSVLAANVSAARMYFQDLQRESERLSLFPTIQSAASRLIVKGSSDGSDSEPDASSSVDKDESVADLQRLRKTILDRPNVAGWVIVNLQGDIVAANRDEWIGVNAKLSTINQKALGQRQSIVVLPNATSDEDSDSPDSQVRTMLLVVSPLLQEKQVIGAIGWAVNPAERFSRIMEVARASQSDETYAFDRDGRLLTRSRFEAQLRQVGLLDNNGETSSILNVRVLNPGDNLIEGKQATTPVESRPLTLMADQATRGASGVNVEGYNDYRGVPVVGAWRWLPEYEFGMTTEIDVAEAYRPTAILRNVVLVLLGLFLLAVALIFTLLAFSKRLGDQSADTSGKARRLGQYELQELLGVGGMGSVYRGRHQFLRRDVAIKVLEGEHLTPQAIKRFRREVKLTSTLRHPNTIAVFDYGQAQCIENRSRAIVSNDKNIAFYYVMEYIDGISLQQLIDYYGPQSPERTVHLLLQICGSIIEAHEAGLVHRDIKPANILLCAQAGSWDHVKVLDFGLVKDVTGDNVTLAPTVTRSDSITGTPRYIAPETIRDAQAASFAGDLYSIGAVGYALLTGHCTYEGESVIDICLKQLESPPVRPEIRLKRSLPDPLQDLIMSCLELDPDRRPPSVAEFAKQLEKLSDVRDWTQAQSVDWWQNVFDQRSQHDTEPIKGVTLADAPLKV